MTIALPKPSILFLDDVLLATAEYEDLHRVADVLHVTPQSRKEFLLDLTQHKFGNVVGIYRHFKADRSITVTGRFDSELVSCLPDSVRFIAHNGAGYDQIDVETCSSRGIQVANVPSVVDAPTADTAMYLILSCLRQFPLALVHAQQGSFNSRVPLSNDPQGKLLGILGLGGIGTALAVRAKAFGMKVGYHNRSRLPLEQETALGVSYIPSLDELLKTSDVISLNLPLNASTKHIISKEAFSKMKPSAILLNTARGPVIDEVALIEALKSGTIAGAGLDVYEHEPKIPEELLQDPKVVCLPHVGTVSVETQREMEAVCMRNLIHALSTGHLPYVVKEQQKEL
ncbi:2-hydroxyacid dehydrogenase [Kwoniella heveanensis BCC8398]|uniref:2-hydroxyacid dehydrogenase n=1 Tax=Kwoniella heveanensis BCC8398 TaxID=1296120 RepID=A0A1B9GYX7_9TREE|nr:2-hydroxyacid dehydrogenase [Kwoniella heveanensis BCC8398]